MNLTALYYVCRIGIYGTVMCIASTTTSEWLLFNANSAIFQLYHGENRLICNEMIMRSTLYEINRLSWMFIVLAHWNKSLQVDMSLHSDTLFWFRDNQSLLFPLNAACIADKQQIPILLSSVWPDRGSNPRSTALDASTQTITTPIRWEKPTTNPYETAKRKSLYSDVPLTVSYTEK